MASWRPAHALTTLKRQVKEMFPNRATSDDGTIAGDEHHKQNPSSDHEVDIDGVVKAMDLTHDPAHGFDSYAFADWLLKIKDPRIKYVISNRRIAGDAAYARRNRVTAWKWARYSGSNPHDHHVHVSVNKANGDDAKDWDLSGYKAGDPGELPTPTPPILRQGSKGADVVKVQKILGVTADGEFGPVTENAVKAFQRSHGIVVDGVVGRMTWAELLDTATSVGIAPKLYLVPNVQATVFGGGTEVEKSAYDGHRISESELAVALPVRFKGARPTVKVTNRATGLSAVGTVEDVGPWNGITPEKSDPYWEYPGRRPQAESGRDLNGRKTNLAGIDLSPGLARAIGVKAPATWSGRVDIEIIPPPA